MNKVKVLDPDFEDQIATIDYVSMNDGYPYARLCFEDGHTGIFFLDEFEVLS